jgi:translation initiation factor 3 subunit F
LSLNIRSGPSVQQYRVHPVVVFSILDHYKRRNDGLSRVVGTLLGHREPGSKIVSITNCFPVLHSENEDEVVLDPEFHAKMLGLHKKVNKYVQVVGWYSTGDKISYVSSLIHDLYKEQLQIEEPLLLTVDVNVRAFSRLAVKGYVGRSFKIGKRPAFIARFESVDLEIHAYEGEKIGVDALINGTPESEALDAPATILSDFDNLEASLTKLWEMLSTVGDHVQKVLEGSVEGDPEVGAAIAHAIAAIPHLREGTLNKMFTSKIQDILMIQYLSNVTRAQLALSDKISALL